MSVAATDPAAQEAESGPAGRARLRFLRGGKTRTGLL
ncbi:ABC transporter permease, partial [Streptomyces sp. JAC128]